MDVKNIKITKLDKSDYIKPYKILYTQNSKELFWDCINTHDSVACVLYHKEFDSFIFVKQFRPSLWAYQSRNELTICDGISVELCAGIMDKGLSQEDTIKEEIIEECGYKVDKVYKICDNFLSLGIGASKQGLFYACVDESMRVSDGGGCDDECIEVEFIKRDEVLNFINNPSYFMPTSLKYGVLIALEKFI